MRISGGLVALAAIISIQAPASAQDAHIRAIEAGSAINDANAPMGFTTAVNLRVPIGPVAEEKEEVRYDMTLAYGQSFDTTAQPLHLREVRSMELAQINFDGDGARDIQLANLGVSDFGREDIEGQRLNFGAEGFILYPLIGIGVAVLVASTVADGDDE